MISSVLLHTLKDLSFPWESILLLPFLYKASMMLLQTVAPLSTQVVALLHNSNLLTRVYGLGPNWWQFWETPNFLEHVKFPVCTAGPRRNGSLKPKLKTLTGLHRALISTIQRCLNEQWLRRYHPISEAIIVLLWCQKICAASFQILLNLIPHSGVRYISAFILMVLYF